MNVTKKVMREHGIEPRPYSEWSDEMKIRYDRLVYGTACVRVRPDGSLEHVQMNPAPRVLGDGQA